MHIMNSVAGSGGNNHSCGRPASTTAQGIISATYGMDAI